MGLRADAEKNRRAITGAAGALFAEQGLDIPLDQIARRAGVGSATLYRRFPDRCALVEAVFAERMEGFAAVSAESAVADDPWQGFIGLMTHLCGAQAEDLGLSELLTTTLFDAGPRIAKLRREMLRSLRGLIERLREAGLVPADFADQDIVLILIGNAGIVRATHADAPEAWRRHLAFVLRGVGGPGAIAELPPPSTVEEIEAAMRARFPLSADAGL
jgi:AcrR family transcriptional regulator